MTPEKIRDTHIGSRLSALRGAAQLVAHGASGVVGVVEGVHHSVLTTLGLGSLAKPERTGGLTGLVYRGIHGTVRQVGRGADGLLAAAQALATPGAGRQPSRNHVESDRHARYVSILNGVLGDHLAEHDNPLALPMTLRHRGQVLGPDCVPPGREVSEKVLLLIHGLCMNERQWGLIGRDDAWATALGYTVVRLRYNSGLHVSRNGRQLAAALTQLGELWPVPISEISLVGHSMGGLVARSACHIGQAEGQRWAAQLKHMVFLGTPHHGAPLERAGNWVDVLLSSTRYSAPFARIGQLRSAGITDLRHGHVLDEHWQGRHRFQRLPDGRSPVPLPEGVRCHAIAATIAPAAPTLTGAVLGPSDGLVPLDSAMGRHPDPQHALRFARRSQWVVRDTSHLGLLNEPRVLRRMAGWLAGR